MRVFYDPDPQASFTERHRLFALPRSSWQDYDRALVSTGGGVFSRTLKEIALSPQAQALLALATDKATPQQVMHAILKAPVDLLFFGGIGTYVRAAAETDDAVGDRANDAIRVTGGEIRRQGDWRRRQSRHDAARAGRGCAAWGAAQYRCHRQFGRREHVRYRGQPQDRAWQRPMRDGRISRDERNRILANMTEDVAALVLRNNYLQTLALSLAERRGLEDLGFEQRLMQTLEAAGALDRTVEFLPDDMEISERRGRAQALTRPELSVLLAYAKLSLNHELLASDVPDDPYLGRELGRYFPKLVAERFPDALERHRLRREIIVTQLANSIINRGGPSFLVRIADQTGARAANIAAAFAAVRDSYGMTAINNEIDALDNRIPGSLQLALYAAVQDLLLDRVVWFLRNVEFREGLAAIVAHYRAGIAAVESALERALPEAAAMACKARQDGLTRDGVPEELARRIARLPVLVAAPDIVMVADRTGRDINALAAIYFAAEAFFRLDQIVPAARGIVVSDYFERLALDRAVDSIGEVERRLAAAMAGNGAAGAAAVDAWAAARQADVERVRMSVNEIAGSGLTLAKLTVAASLLGDLARN